MGRHGGGSRSGGSRSSSRSRSGSRSGGSGSSHRTSTTKPFVGCYNRSYYDRRGRYHTYYTSNSNYGTKSGWNLSIIVSLIFITFNMLIMIAGFSSTFINFGSKINGDSSRIFIEDRIDLLTSEQKEKAINLFKEVYEKSGMPITLVVDDFSWQNNFETIEACSEDAYYSIGYDEKSMIILYTTDYIREDFLDWEYDIYCGDDTIKCLSDNDFDKLLENLQGNLYSKDLVTALEISFGTVMGSIGKTSLNPAGFGVLVPILFIYGLFYFALISSAVKNNAAYKYFKENPEKLTRTPMTLYSECPSCGASNTEQLESCMYCGTLLKISDGKINFIKPN